MSAAHRVSGSRVSLALLCGYWARPDVHVPEDPPGPAAQQGTLLHDLAERHLAGAELPEVPRNVAKRWTNLRVWLDRWRDGIRERDGIRYVEEAWAYDVDRETLRFVPREAGRDYNAGPREVPARIDLGAAFRDHVEIWDIKSGRSAPSVYGNGQLLTGLLMLATKHCVSRGVMHVVHAQDSGIDVYSEAVELWDLEAHAFDLRAMLDGLPTSQPQPGLHCSGMYCALRNGCPALGQDVAVSP